MAQLVLGIGTSHSPMVSMLGEDWIEWGKGDHTHTMLYTRDGRHITYHEALATAAGRMVDRISPAVCDGGAQRVAAAVERLRAEVTAAELDVLVVVGDDQDEQLLASNLPPFLIYWGETMTNRVRPGLADMAPHFRRFVPAYSETDHDREYPVAVELARHMIHTAYEHDFDVATSNDLPQQRGMGHAFAFPLRHIARRADLPMVPVMINTYNPPAQPRAARCAAFGTMVRAAIDSFPGDARVGVCASGGLSHFMVLEDLDREVIAAFERRDLAAVCSIPEATFQAGTSEIKNWIVAASCMADHEFELVDYVPGYRTEAGSGTGLAFALWKHEATIDH